MCPELAGLKAADGEIPAQDRAEQLEYGAVEQVEAAVTPRVRMNRVVIFSMARRAGPGVLDGRRGSRGTDGWPPPRACEGPGGCRSTSSRAPA